MRRTAEELERLGEALRTLLGDEGLISDEEQRRGHSADLLGTGATCAFLLRPNTIEDLQRAVALAAEAGLAIVPRGGGLTYVGGYVTDAPDFVAVDLRRLDRIVEINARDMYITVEAGVTWRQIHEALKPLGLRLPFFGTFSGRGATVGGGLSNGALFLGTARYGSAPRSCWAWRSCLPAELCCTPASSRSPERRSPSSGHSALIRPASSSTTPVRWA